METADRAGEQRDRAPQHGAPDAGAPSTDPADGNAAESERDLDELLAEARRERDEYLDLAQRARADFENYRRRAAEAASEAERRGRAALAKGLLGGLDNLERALRAAGIDPDASAAEQTEEPLSEELSAHETLAQGVALVYRELRATLESAGVKSYDPIGERFDPAWHEAIATRPADGEVGVVIETIHKGYRLDGQVLRAAGVLVSE